jgi:hypothetical protein
LKLLTYCGTQRLAASQYVRDNKGELVFKIPNESRIENEEML